MVPLPLIGTIRAYLAEKLDLHATNNNRSKKQIIKPVNSGSGTQVINVLNLNATNEEEKSELRKILKEVFEEGSLVLLDDDTKKLVTGVTESEQQSGNYEVINFFKGKISNIDLQLLRTGLYIDHMMRQGIDTSKIRSDALSRYGDRERNVLKLASSGHFTSHIMPLYKEMGQSPSFAEADFKDEYERILSEMPFAIFVTVTYTDESLKAEVVDKISQADRNSVTERRLFVHGWGRNVNKIESCLSQLSAENKDLKISQNKRTEAVEIIDATIEF